MKKAILMRLPEEVYEKLKELAKEERWSLNKIGEVAVEYYLKLRKKWPSR